MGFLTSPIVNRIAKKVPVRAAAGAIGGLFGKNGGGKSGMVAGALSGTPGTPEAPPPATSLTLPSANDQTLVGGSFLPVKKRKPRTLVGGDYQT